MEPTRLNKYLVDAGVCSRREADRLMEEGRITVDGRRAVLGQKVTGNEKIFVDRKPVKKPESIERVYIAYHKPVGIICTSDPKAKDNIIEAVNYPDGRIFHIGRLDVASSGLILLTNDGDIVNAILRAEGQHEKEYIVKVDKDITDEMVTSLRNGVHIGDDRPTLPAKIMKMGARMFSITIVEGRNRQIRRMCEAVGLNVESLKRIRVMGIKLDDIPPGKWRFLTEQETSALKAALV
ncbi:MAG: Pseudouridine synthase [Candidatus Uhrbacteria bacterium GW2011_GWD2_52_7]|uniref:Pseudouridine synthase n=1 Tax=Candidatus Uhrbacteria bacterium GW2011_GWD2_52_7 TaxID=1618989 RepID=A0A0G1XGL7_9BACT|nr:MAG: Pseudouridine synthase [Candidatus Uhrbacteria bacterium GW2011_GWD2_52_7]